MTANSGEEKNRPKFGAFTKGAFCLGAASTGFKTMALTSLLLVFYNQVVGLSPASVGLAIMIALFVDAILDPAMGILSDNFRSPLGRRHPFMYAAAIPLATGFIFLWTPPNWSPEALFFYMLVWLLFIRLFDTMYEVPASALVPELATGYNERTFLLSIRYVFEPLGGLVMSLLAYQVFMREGLDGTGGVLDRAGYLPFAIAGAAFMAATIVISTAATQRFAPYLTQAKKRKITFSLLMRELYQPFKQRNFRILAIAGLLISISSGVFSSMALYMSLYFWELSQAQLSLLTIPAVLSSFVGPFLAHALGARFGKRLSSAACYGVAIVAIVGPVFLRLLGLAPQNGDDAVFVMLLAAAIVAATCVVATAVLIASLVADVVEEVELESGERSEGVVISANQFFRKVVSGVGVFVAGLILTVINFPKGAERGTVSDDVLNALGVSYAALFACLSGASLVALLLLRSSKAQHEDNLRMLAQRRSQ